jgi:hypothetical protein
VFIESAVNVSIDALCVCGHKSADHAGYFADPNAGCLASIVHPHCDCTCRRFELQEESER